MEEIDIERIMYWEHTRRTAEARYETNPLDADNLTKWGAVMLEFSQFQNGPESKKMVQDAIEKLEEALVVNPDQHDALWCLGNAYTANGLLNPDLDEATGSFDQAAQHFELAYELQPQNMNYKRSLEAVSKALEVHADFHKHGFAQQAMGPGGSAHQMACLIDKKREVSEKEALMAEKEDQFLAEATSVEKTFGYETQSDASSGVQDSHSLLSSNKNEIGTSIVCVRISKSQLLIGLDFRTNMPEVHYDILVTESFRKYKVFRKHFFIFYAGFMNRASAAIDYMDTQITSRRLFCNTETIILLVAEFFQLFPPETVKPETPKRTCELLMCCFSRKDKEYKIFEVGDHMTVPQEKTDDVFGIGSEGPVVASNLESLPKTVASVSSEMIRACTISPYTGGKIKVFSLDEDSVLKVEYKSSLIQEVLNGNLECTNWLFNSITSFVIIEKTDEEFLSRMFLQECIGLCGCVFWFIGTENLVVYLLRFNTEDLRQKWFELHMELDFQAPQIGYGKLQGVRFVTCVPKLSLVHRLFYSGTLNGLMSGRYSGYV